MSPWRNRLARSAVNRKDVGSSPTGDENFVVLFIYLFDYLFFYFFIPDQGDRDLFFSFPMSGLIPNIFALSFAPK